MNRLSPLLNSPICFLVLMALSSCKKDSETQARPDFSGKYVGEIQGIFYQDFLKPPGTPFSEDAEFVINSEGECCQIAGFDSIPARMDFGDKGGSAFIISDVRNTGEFRIGASGEFSGDTLKMGGRYIYLDKSRREYQFVGVRK